VLLLGRSRFSVLTPVRAGDGLDLEFGRVLAVVVRCSLLLRLIND
jgi:hypothetical protein